MKFRTEELLKVATWPSACLAMRRGALTAQMNCILLT
jgi:hypothetical protein